jgi:hypothetical protein
MRLRSGDLLAQRLFKTLSSLKTLENFRSIVIDPPVVTSQRLPSLALDLRLLYDTLEQF